jgi:hypothetical protein
MFTNVARRIALSWSARLPTAQEQSMTDRTTPPAALSRRSVLHLAIAGGGVLLAGTVATPAAAKIAQKSAHYQGMPKGKARCDNCRQWQAPAACKVVDGAISPAGWCMLYAPK